MKCVNCSYENDADAEFCENCGNTLRSVCASCGNPLKPGAKFCKKCGTAVSAQPPSTAEKDRLKRLQQAAPSNLKDKIRVSSAQIEGERKPVTILFTDIVGSTALAEKLDPEEWKEVVSGAHQRVSQAVYRYEGTIAQLLGDGVLAFFGAPITHEDDPIRAVHAALDIQQATGEYAQELKGVVDNFQLRVGLNTGTVVVGSVGSDMHMEYLAIGDAVNLAARLQSAAQPGEVLVSESTARLVGAVFELGSLGEINVKGKAEPVTVYTVVKAKAKPESGRGFEELHSALVGRDSELAAFHEALEALFNGHGQIVAIIGEAGIGKSRLAEEALRDCSGDHPGMDWIEGRGLSYGQTLSFWTITQLIYSDLGLSDGDPEVRVRAALKRRVNSLFGEAASEVLPYLGNLLGVNLESGLAEQVRLLDGETLKRQTLLSIGRYFERLAAERPTIMVFEDLHWADPSSLEALEQLMSATDRVPLMLVLLSRLEREHSSWRIKLKAETDYAHRYTEILLRPLSQPEQNHLVDNLLAIADLPVSVRQLMLEHAEGNPFYLEEIVRSLIDQGAIIHDGESWRATQNITDIEIPDTLQGVLLARIDRLQDEVRHTLQLASVIGKSFLYRLLGAIAEAEQQLDQHLAQLQRVDLVREKTSQPELEYMFKHSLTQEAAYNSLLVDRRREFHRRVGEALEELFADRKEQFLGLLAHHFEGAGEYRKAVDYLIQAGDRARLTDEHLEAADHYREAIKLLTELGDDRGAAQVWLKLGLIYHANFQFELAHQANEKAFDLQKRAGPPAPAAREVEQYPLRISIMGKHVTLDPGKCRWSQDAVVISQVFSGLARIDDELNVVPEIARSWQVLEDGRRYLFYLRDDWRWTNGVPVTAQDFEWAWKRNLSPAFGSTSVEFLYDVVGAQDYHQGRNVDPGSLGIRALDAHALEVRLEEPVAYFPFITTMPVALPLPRQVIERFGEDWWQAEHIVSNGVFRLIQFDPQQGGVMERNPGYAGLSLGNVQRVEWRVTNEFADRIEAYQNNQVDIAFSLINLNVPDSVPETERHPGDQLSVYFMVFRPDDPPFDDLRARKAVAMSLDRAGLHAKFGIPICRGGLVPPGMPGHSPDIELPFDVDTARKLLDEAGYPGGKGFPTIKMIAPRGRPAIFNEMARQWGTDLGIEILLEETDPWEISDWKRNRATSELVINGWTADYPDPDNFLGHTEALALLRLMGWQDPAFDQLIDEAARTPDRARRMAMYRQADRLLVADQALVLPLSYGEGGWIYLIKPWVKNIPAGPFGMRGFQNLIMEAH
jgi:ABC-type oligopeptide transport system substrate-binding subunit/class 3 adenylate cyclase